MDVRRAAKHDLAAENPSQNAAHRPHVDGRTVVVHRIHEQLGRAVPARDDVVARRQLERAVVLPHGGLVDAAREPEIAEREATVGINEHVGGLEVAVDDVRRVHKLEPAQQLVRGKYRACAGDSGCADLMIVSRSVPHSGVTT